MENAGRPHAPPNAAAGVHSVQPAASGRPATTSHSGPSLPDVQSLVVERVSDAVIALDTAGIVTYLNPSAERRYGVAAAQAVGRPLADLYAYEWLDPEDETRAAAALAQQGSWRGENRHVRRDGRVFHVESEVIVMQDEAGAAVGLLAVIRDVTDARRADAELRRREERFRRALASETVGVLFFSLDGRVTDANGSFERMSGYTVDELRHFVHWRQLTVPAFFDVTNRAAAELRLHGRTEPYEKQMIRKDGSRWWGLFAPRRIDGTGGTAECVEFIVDITDTKRAEAALRESDERQRMALDAADLGTWRHDVLAGRIDLDARAREHYGVDRESVEAGALLARIHPEDRATLQQAIGASLDPQRKVPVRAEYRVLTADGGVRWLSVNGRVSFETAADGERGVAGVGTTRDVTEQKRAEEILREADRRKDEFIAILAHELRNPLAPIRTAVGILRAPDLPEPLTRRSREIIERQVAHMTRLIDDLLDVSRLSRGQMTLQRGPVRLDDVLDAAVETARPVIEERGHRFEQHRSASPVWMDGDLARLSQVFANLLNNAARYTPAGGAIALHVRASAGTVDVDVADSGQGIAPERLDTIFDLFAQGSGASSPSLGGLGIGLALARRLVDLHGGTIRAASAGIGRGATFTVTLPTTIDRRGAPADRGDAVAANLGRRVLVVDDSADAADSTATLLEAAGCLVKTTYGGEAAVAEVPVFQPEIVLLDIGMPGLNGLEACRRIRALPGGTAVFLIAVTGWGQDEDRRRTRDAGFDAHLVKPVDPDVLLAVVDGAPRPDPPPGDGARSR